MRRADREREQTAWDRYNEQREAAHAAAGNVDAVAETMVEELRDTVARDQRGEPMAYAPLARRIAAAMMDGAAQIEAKVSEAIAEVNATVASSLDQLQLQLDQLRAAAEASAEAAQFALRNHIAIASRTLQQAGEIRDQIAEFKMQVERAMPAIDPTPPSPLTGNGQDVEEEVSAASPERKPAQKG
jgi:hypothetical protein